MTTKLLNLTDLVAKLFLGFLLLGIGVVAYAAPPQTPPGLFKASHMPAHPQLPPNAKAGKVRPPDLGDFNMTPVHKMRGTHTSVTVDGCGSLAARLVPT
jgi:hypothetical protein